MGLFGPRILSELLKFAAIAILLSKMAILLRDYFSIFYDIREIKNRGRRTKVNLFLRTAFFAPPIRFNEIRSM